MTQKELKQRLMGLVESATIEEVIKNSDEKSIRLYKRRIVGYAEAVNLVERLIANGVTIRERGEWIVHEDDWCGTYYTCSACKCDWTTVDGRPQENNMRYCPECGADMRGKNDE